MADKIELRINGKVYQLEVEPDTPLLYVLRNELGCLLQYKNVIKLVW